MSRSEQKKEFIPFVTLTFARFVPFAEVVRSVGLARVFEDRTRDVATSAASGEQISDNLALFCLD